MNKPVAWIIQSKYGTPALVWNGEPIKYNAISAQQPDIPLYTHPVKEQKCIVKDCENHKHEGGFVGDLCKPCHQFITTGEGVYSQAYRNSHPVKELTDEEITEVWTNMPESPDDIWAFAKAILRKAQEK